MKDNLTNIFFLLQELNLDFYHIKIKNYEIILKNNKIFHYSNFNFNIYYSSAYNLKSQSNNIDNLNKTNSLSNNLSKHEYINLKQNNKTIDSTHQSENKELIDIHSPLPGIFYSSPMPGADPFVKVGSIVNSNTIVCIIETMKIMNQIKADKNGRVEKIFFKDGDEISIGDVLMQISPL